MSLKVVFMGTPEFAVPIVKLLNDSYEVVGVVTQPDKMVGRKKIMTPPPVKVVSEELGLKVFQPRHIKEEYQPILDLKPDLIVTCAYGQILPEEILNYPKYGCINVHASLLPKLRGGAPIHHAIIDGYKETGITIMYMSKKMDQGDILTQVKTEIRDDDTLGTLQYKLSEMAKDLLKATIPLLIDKKIVPLKQKEEEATYGYNISREEEKIDFSKSTIDIFNQIRGLNPWPGAYTTLDGVIVKIYNARISDSFFTTRKDGEIGKVYSDGIGVSTHDGEIIITELQFAGKRKMSVKEYFNGVDKESLIGKVFE